MGSEGERMTSARGMALGLGLGAGVLRMRTIGVAMGGGARGDWAAATGEGWGRAVG